MCPYSSSVHLPQRVDPLEMLLVVTHLTDGDFMTVDWRGRRRGRNREGEEQGGEGGRRVGNVLERKGKCMEDSKNRVACLMSMPSISYHNT